MYDEDQEGLAPVEYNQHLHGRSCASKLDLPPLPRQETQFIGLKNQYPFLYNSKGLPHVILTHLYKFYT